MINIDFGKIVTNVISTIVTMCFVGACMIVWKAATTVDDKVNAANAGLKVVVQEVQEKLVDLQKQNNELVEMIIGLKNQIEKDKSGQEMDLSKVKNVNFRKLPEKDFLEQKMAPYEQKAKY